MELPFYSWAKRIVCSEPSLYQYFIATRSVERKELAINKNSSIVIDGFPRSGNTFAVVVFMQWQQGKVGIAHHTHAPATVIEGCRRRLPVVVLIRNPVDACASLAVFSGRKPSTLMHEWIWFYRRCWRHRDRFLIVPFELTVKDFGIAIDAVNKKWNTSFSFFDMDAENLNAAYARISEIAKGHGHGENKVAMPSSFRTKQTEAARELLRRNERKLQEATVIYRKYLDLTYRSCFGSKLEGA